LRTTVRRMHPSELNRNTLCFLASPRGTGVALSTAHGCEHDDHAVEWSIFTYGNGRASPSRAPRNGGGAESATPNAVEELGVLRPARRPRAHRRRRLPVHPGPELGAHLSDGACGTRPAHRHRLGHRQPQRGDHGPRRQPGLRNDQGARRRLQHGGAHRADRRPHRTPLCSTLPSTRPAPTSIRRGRPSSTKKPRSSR
jgi:hypothetical protein